MILTNFTFLNVFLGGDGETHNFWDTHTHGHTDRQTDRGSYRSGAQLKICYF